MKKELKNYEEKAVRIYTLYYYGSRNSRARICGGTSAKEFVKIPKVMV